MMVKTSSVPSTTRRSFPFWLMVILALLLVLGIAVGCTKGRNDAQIASEVQSKVLSDPNVPSRQISVQAQNGVVTLAGNVTSDQERAAAANAAAQVPGVKTVVNNLQVAPPATAQTTAPEPAQQQETAASAPPEPAREARKSRPSGQRATSTRGSSRATTPDYNSGSASSSTNTSASTSNVTPSAPIAPAPIVPQKVTIPDGTTLAVRLIDSLDSERNQVGDSFRGTLSSPVVVNDDVVLPADADVEGRVVDVKSAGRFAGASTLVIELTKISVNGRSYPVHTNQWSKQGTARGKSTAAKVGGGAALGAIIGGLAGGGKGAAIGATVGAGAGTGASAATKGQQIRLNSEALLTFQLQSPITVTPVTQANRGGRQND